MYSLIIWVPKYFSKKTITSSEESLILVGIFYFPLKYTFAGINKLFHLIHLDRRSNLKYKEYTRRRFKPAKPHKIRMK